MAVYFLVTNLVTFLCFAHDKRAAIREKRRVPELTLLALCVLGGSAGGLLGMLVCHHKTQKPLFSVGVPLILAGQTALGLWFLLGQKGGV